ncbi:MAG TPA: caspase family protein [Xanthobacteraceae bacterium]|nr:caspase family protein [Xanthobacteraceae bacterium]
MKTGSLAALFALAAIAASGPAAAETRALIVGVSNYQNLDPSKYLSGPKNDVKEIQEFLLQRGVKKNNITLLADGVSAEKPTRQNIMDALRALTERSQRGDFAIVYFSGHGSYQPDQPEGDPRHDEEDGFDEVFIPYDVEPTPLEQNAQAIRNAIIDDELGEFADAIRDKGVDLWFILDSCHSGTGLRASGQFHEKKIEPWELGVRVDKSPSSRKTAVIHAPYAAASRSTDARGRYVFFSASRANETSTEIPMPGSVPAKDAVWRSVFTHALVTVMTRAPKLTYSQIIEEVNRVMGTSGGHVTQTAGIEGNMINRLVFGHDAAPDAALQWQVAHEIVYGGIANGIEKGAILALYDDPSAKDTAATGYAQVIEASPTEAKISPLREYPCPLVDGNPACRMGGAEIITRARYARLLSPPLDFAFAVSAPRFTERTPETLRARAAEVFNAFGASGSENKQLQGRVRFDDTAPDFIWWVTADGFRMAPAGSDPLKLDIGAAVDLKGSEPLDEVKAATQRILLRAYRVERLRRLAATDAGGLPGRPRLKVGFGSMPLNYDGKSGRCEADQLASMQTVEGPLVATPCMRVQINIKNEGPLPRFVNPFLIDDKWNFIDFCEQGGKDSTLAPGATRSCKINYGRALPGGADLERFTLVILSTPQRQNVGARNFDDIINLNNLDAGGAGRGGSDQLNFDDGLAGDTEGTRATPFDKNPATVTLVEWDLDLRGKR